MAYDLDTWRDRIEHLLEISADPDDHAVLERAQQAISIGHQPEASDQLTIDDLWFNAAGDEDDTE